MNKPIWLRVAVQVGMALLATSFTLPMPKLTGDLINASGFLQAARGSDAERQALSKAEREVQVLGALLFFVWGGLAAFASWLVARKPWDALGTLAVIVILALMSDLSWALVHGAPWARLAETVVGVLPFFAGCALVAWLAQRRASAHHDRTQQAAQAGLLS